MDHPLRIWIFSNEFEPYIIGGLGTAVTNLAKAYVYNKIAITVISHSNNTRPEYSQRFGLRIVRFPKSNAYYTPKSLQYKPLSINRSLRALGYRKPDGIHIHSTQFVQLAKVYQTKYNIPVIYTCHSIVALEEGSTAQDRQYAIKLQIKLLKMANLITVPSRWELLVLEKLYPFCANKTVVIPHGVTKGTTIAKGPRNKLLFIGRLIPMKGIDHLLKAISLLKHSGYPIKLDLVGTGPREYVKHLRSIAKNLGIEHDVRWLGYRTQSQLQRIKTSHGALVMPSHQESFGLVALEALASGIPLVSTRAGGLSDFVSNRVAQTISKSKGIAIAAAIKQMWKNKKLTNKRVIAGRKLATRYYWPKVALKYEKSFQKRK